MSTDTRPSAQLRAEHTELHAELTAARQQHDLLLDDPKWNTKAHEQREQKISVLAKRVEHLTAAITRADRREAEAAAEARKQAVRDEAQKLLGDFVAVIDNEMHVEHEARVAYLRAAAAVRVKLAPIADRLKGVLESVSDRDRDTGLMFCLSTLRGRDADQAHSESSFFAAAAAVLGLDQKPRTPAEIEELVAAGGQLSLADATRRGLPVLRGSLAKVDPALRMPDPVVVEPAPAPYVPTGGRPALVGRTVVDAATIAADRRRELAVARAAAGLSNDVGAPYDLTE